MWRYPKDGDLPKETDDYLVCIEKDNVRAIDIATYYAGANKWYIETELIDTPVEPTAWAYLPDLPPKERA